MSRLIDVDKLPFEKMEISATSGEWCVRLSDIEYAPTVDAVEVVRNGNVVNKSEVIAQCPTIGCNRRFRLTLKNREKYCPECGQKLNWSVLDGYRMVEDVKGCTAPRCPLYAFRFGKNPYIHREMSEEQRQAAAERLAEARYKKGSENEDKT